MLKRPITYKDFNDNEITEDFYFNLSKPELIEMEVEHSGGMNAWLNKVITTQDHKQLIRMFKEIVLKAYGEKSEDGRRFVKSEEISTAFSQTNAYVELFMELATNHNAAADFLIGVMPADIANDPEVKKQMQAVQNQST